MRQRTRKVAFGLLTLMTATVLMACGNQTPDPQPKPVPTTAHSVSPENVKAINAALAMLDDIRSQVVTLDLNIYGPATDSGVHYSGEAQVSGKSTGFQLSVNHGTEAEKDWVKRVKSAEAKVDDDLVTFFTRNVNGLKGVDSLLELEKDYKSGVVLVRRQVADIIYVAEISTGGWDGPTTKAYDKLRQIAAQRLSEI